MLRRIVKLQTVRIPHGFVYRITIPKVMVEALGWEKGRKLLVELDIDKKQVIVQSA